MEYGFEGSATPWAGDWACRIQLGGAPVGGGLGSKKYGAPPSVGLLVSVSVTTGDGAPVLEGGPSWRMRGFLKFDWNCGSLNTSTISTWVILIFFPRYWKGNL